MATAAITTSQKLHLHAHPMDSATPPNPVPSANLSWSIVSGPPSGAPTLAVDADKMGAVLTAGTGASTWGVRWQAPNGNGDTTLVTITVDTTVISGGTTTTDPPEQKP